jgi:hypothetical protein
VEYRHVTRPDIELHVIISPDALILLKLVLIEAETDFIERDYGKYARMLEAVRGQLPSVEVLPDMPPIAQLN